MNQTTASGAGPVGQTSAQVPEAPWLNIANVLTVVRLALVPVFVWLMLQPGHQARLWAAGVFAVAAFTDHLDGALARARNLITTFGKIADPIADKALTLSAFGLLSVAGRLWWWVTGLIVIRELGITLLRFLMLRRAVMAASRGGKLKTVLQIGGIMGLLVPWAALLPASGARSADLMAYAMVGAALVVTLVTGVDYVIEAARLSRDPGRRQ